MEPSAWGAPGFPQSWGMNLICILICMPVQPLPQQGPSLGRENGALIPTLPVTLPGCRPFAALSPRAHFYHYPRLVDHETEIRISEPGSCCQQELQNQGLTPGQRSHVQCSLPNPTLPAAWRWTWRSEPSGRASGRNQRAPEGSLCACVFRVVWVWKGVFNHLPTK